MCVYMYFSNNKDKFVVKTKAITIQSIVFHFTNKVLLNIETTLPGAS